MSVTSPRVLKLHCPTCGKMPMLSSQVFHPRTVFICRHNASHTFVLEPWVCRTLDAIITMPRIPDDAADDSMPTLHGGGQSIDRWIQQTRRP